MNQSVTNGFPVRYLSIRLPVAISFVSIVAGGVVAALTGPLNLRLGSWLAAFLVLVGGVAQLGMVVGQAWLETKPPGRAMSISQVVTWNGGVVGVMVGTLIASPLLVSVASVVFGASVVLSLLAVRGSRRSPRWLGLTYRILGGIVLISIPVGIALSWWRS